MNKFLIIIIPFYLFCACCTKKPKKLDTLFVPPQCEEYKKWMTLHLEGEPFTASFPKTPNVSTRNIPIRGEKVPSLYCKNFFCEIEDGTVFSISYSALPSNWLKYGTSLVLKEALKLILKDVGKTEVVGKKMTSFKSFPALDYEYYSVCENQQTQGQQKETTGILVLIDTVLYKIEMTYSPMLHNKNDVVYFIQNFCPNTQSSGQSDGVDKKGSQETPNASAPPEQQ